MINNLTKVEIFKLDNSKRFWPLNRIDSYIYIDILRIESIKPIEDYFEMTMFSGSKHLLSKESLRDMKLIDILSDESIN